MKKLIYLFVFLFTMGIIVGCSENDNSANASDSGVENFPEKPIEVVVPYPPGGNSDTTTRIIVEGASKYLPNDGRFTVVNIEGGASATGLTEAARADSDGHTIAQSTAGGIVTVPILNNTSYDLDDFEPILQAVTIPQMLVTRSDSQWENFEDWLEYVEENPNDFQYANNGVGNVQHIQMETLEDAAGIETTIIPFEGGAASAAAMLGGNADAVITFPGTLEPGEINVLLNFGNDRSEYFPEVPTMKELYGVGVDNFVGFFAPKGVPEERLEIIHDALKKALEDEEVIERLDDFHYEVAYKGLEDFKAFVEENIEVQSRIADGLSIE